MLTLWNRCMRDRKMGQAWCKDRSTKAQESKSTLDSVFLRCAHRIYPGLKEEGSVIGGATQRVTSSIGYSASPPRELLTRGRSIDSIDRPFQPSDWVDVNLEVPSTPRASSSVTTNLTLNTTLYHTTSSCFNSKDITPIPPPRRKRKNWGRPLPPKPSKDSIERSISLVEPLYSSVIPKNRSYIKNKNDGHDCRRTKDIFEYKVNGTGKIIGIVSGWKSVEGLSPSQTELDSRNAKLSTASLPNYDELNGSKLGIADSDDENEVKKQIGNEFESYQIDSIHLAKRLKVDAEKTSTPKKGDCEKPRTAVKVDGWFLHSDGNTRFPNAPPTEQLSSEIGKCPAGQSTMSKPTGNSLDFFFEDKIKNKTNSLDRYPEYESKKILRRALSNENKPFEGANEKTFMLEPMLSTHSPKMLTKSISEESFPSALLEDDVDFFEEKVVKDTKNEITKIREELEAVKNEVKTPPPSPEPNIKPELQSNDHSTLLKVLRDETEESNLSSMTPSLTELEAALSDMLEKETDQENLDKSVSIIQSALKSLEKPIEPKIVPLITNELPPTMLSVDSTCEDVLINCPDTIVSPKKMETKIYQFDAPEKPSRMYSVEKPLCIPTPPRRRNRSSSGVLTEVCVDSHVNDRLI